MNNTVGLAIAKKLQTFTAPKRHFVLCEISDIFT